jgi:hypothetical protein
MAAPFSRGRGCDGLTWEEDERWGQNCQLPEPAALRPFYMRNRGGEQVGGGEVARRRWTGASSFGD